MGHFNIKKKDAVLYQAWHPYFIVSFKLLFTSSLLVQGLNFLTISFPTYVIEYFSSISKISLYSNLSKYFCSISFPLFYKII